MPTPTSQIHKRCLGFALLMAMLVFVPAFARAQSDSGPRDGLAKYAEKKVSLEVDNARLTYAIKKMLGPVEADFIVDNAVSGVRVTLHVHDMPFDRALKALLKACTAPVTYRIEDGIFNFVPGEPEAPEPEQTAEAPKEKQPELPTQEKLDVKNAKASQILQMLFGIGIRNSPVPPGIIANSQQGTGNLARNGQYSTSGFLNGDFFMQNSGSNYNSQTNTWNRQGGGFRFPLGNLLGMLLGGRRR